MAAGFYDISNFATVVIPSTNHRFAYFCDYIIKSQLGNLKELTQKLFKNLYQSKEEQ